MTEADLSNKNLGVGGAIIISAWLTHKDKGALSSLNLAANSIGGYYTGFPKKFHPTPEGKDTLLCLHL
jgi:hypothetical protein